MESHALSDSLDFGSREQYRKLDLPALKRRTDGLLELPAETLEELSRIAFTEIAFRLPASELEGFGRLAADEGASAAERAVAAMLIRNAAIAAEGLLPLCQDTGVAAAYGWVSRDLLASSDLEEAVSKGASRAYTESRLRASICLPNDFFHERNSGDNSPAMVDLRPDRPGRGLRICFSAKGGGSSNRTSLSIASPALLDEASLKAYLEEKIRGLGTSGCPPYRISLVVGGLSPEEALHALSLAGLGLLDSAPSAGGSVLRDSSWEERILAIASRTGLGAQFGGKGLALDARALRLPRHAASLPLALGVSCAARRRARAFVTEDGAYLERLESDPARFLPAELPSLEGAVALDLDQPLGALAEELGRYRSGQLFLLSGTVILARDAAHARFRALMREGRPLPEYLSRHPIFYAGPTEAAPGQVSGSFGPTTAGRMDEYLADLMSRGTSLVTIAKGGRSEKARKAIMRHKGSYLAAIGGAAALTAREQVLESRILDHAELGMEAVRLVRLKDMPAILAIDAEGQDFYAACLAQGS